MKKLRNSILCLFALMLTAGMTLVSAVSFFNTKTPEIVYAWGPDGDNDVVTAGDNDEGQDEDDDTPTDIGDNDNDTDVDLENGDDYVESEGNEEEPDVVSGGGNYVDTTSYYYIDEVCVQEHGYLDESCIKFDEDQFFSDFLDYIEGKDWNEDFDRIQKWWEKFGDRITDVFQKIAEQFAEFFGG